MMGSNQTSFRKGAPGRPKGCKNKITLLGERLDLTNKDIRKIPIELLDRLTTQIESLPFVEKIKATFVLIEFLIGIPTKYQLGGKVCKRRSPYNCSGTMDTSMAIKLYKLVEANKISKEEALDLLKTSKGENKRSVLEKIKRINKESKQKEHVHGTNISNAL